VPWAIAALFKKSFGHINIRKKRCRWKKKSVPWCCQLKAPDCHRQKEADRGHLPASDPVGLNPIFSSYISSQALSLQVLHLGSLMSGRMVLYGRMVLIWYQLVLYLSKPVTILYDFSRLTLPQRCAFRDASKDLMPSKTAASWRAVTRARGLHQGVSIQRVDHVLA